MERDLKDIKKEIKDLTIDESHFNEAWNDFDNMNEADEKLKFSNTIPNFFKRRTFNIEEINKLIPENSSHGTTGLQNLGNTCFMNSAIQCLSNSIDLTYYFLKKLYVEEINSSNNLGLKGKLAHAWYDLLYTLWLENKRSTSPSTVKNMISKLASQFSGYSQHDSHELLTFLLEGLHEDLNKISKKPYREVQEKGDDESEEDAAQRFWDLHIARNDSVIVDLIHGQYRSTITCPECHRTSITYDPFTGVSLPIPDLTKVDIYVIPKYGFKKNMKLSIYVSKEARFCDILHYINLNTNLEEKIARIRCMIVNDNKLRNLTSPADYIHVCAKDGYIFCQEIEVESDFFTVPVHFMVDGEYKTFPRLFVMKYKDNLDTLKFKIYRYMRAFMKFDLDELQEVDNLLKEEKIGHNLYSNAVRKEYESLFGENSNLKNELKEIILNEFPYDIQYSIKGKLSSIDEIKNFDSKQIVINIKNMKYLQEKFKSMSSCVSYSSKERTKSLTLHDCLEHFRLTEKLEKNNEWYCSKCKKHQQAFKKLELFHTPKILILHLKRFSYASKSRYRLSAEKVDYTIDFPLVDLNLSKYIAGPGSNDAIYDLYAVSQHYGSTGGGHYTAICKNFGKWYDFNDSSVSSTDESRVVSNAAYLLFYRKKD